MRRYPYFFEVLVAVNAAWVFSKTWENATVTLRQSIVGVSGAASVAAIIGIVIRMLIAWRRGGLRHYVRILGSRGWLLDSLRIFVGLGLLGVSYTWIKLLVPVFHPVLYDQQLFDLDRTLCFGIAPTVFLLNLFSNPHFLHFIDNAYGSFFVGGMFLSFGIFFSSASSRTRVTFMTSCTLLWLVGAWLYMLVPSLGPAYSFANIWFEYGKDLHFTQEVQAALLKNYKAVIAMAHGAKADVFLGFGIAAFPSLHVATQTLVAIWMRRVWHAGQVIYGFAAFFVFIGSMITGWHYLTDGLAAVVLAFASYGIATWVAKKEFRPVPARS